jgi:hypothetical protein
LAVSKCAFSDRKGARLRGALASAQQKSRGGFRPGDWRIFGEHAFLERFSLYESRQEWRQGHFDLRVCAVGSDRFQCSSNTFQFFLVSGVCHLAGQLSALLREV